MQIENMCFVNFSKIFISRQIIYVYLVRDVFDLQIKNVYCYSKVYDMFQLLDRKYMLSEVKNNF